MAAFHPSTWEAEAIYVLEASLVYVVKFRVAEAI